MKKNLLHSIASCIKGEDWRYQWNRSILDVEQATSTRQKGKLKKNILFKIRKKKAQSLN